jgi:DNA anti-recombination protein RmuC
MDKDTMVKYAPMIVVVLSVIFQYNLFVTPEKLEQKHREIIQEVSSIYLTKEQYKEQYDDLKAQMNDIQKKIDEIYKIVIREHK